jgi:hypothetical protein
MGLKSVTCVTEGGFLQTMSGAKKENCLMVQRSIDWHLKKCRDQLLQQLIHIEHVKFGKHVGNKRKHRTSDVDINESNWRKKNIFFKLPYWSILKLRYNLDVMHIEKNICDNILGTLMNIPGKTKNTANEQRDLRKMGIRKDLHLQTNGATTTMTVAVYTLTRDEKNQLCEWLKCLKFSYKYASNIGRCVNKHNSKISGMKAMIIMSSYSVHFMLQFMEN